MTQNSEKGIIWLIVRSDDVYKPAELSNVLYVPSLAMNLFSDSAVSTKGLNMVFDDAKCVNLYSNWTLRGSGITNEKLFTFDSSHRKNSFMMLPVLLMRILCSHGMRGLGIWALIT